MLCVLATDKHCGVTGKIMDYGPEGKREKVPMDHVCWVLYWTVRDYLLRQCPLGGVSINSLSQ